MKAILLLLLSAGCVFSQSYFKAVEPTGLPYTIVVRSLTILSQEATDTLEIGIYDDTLCVGTGISTGLPDMVITVWKGDGANNLPGFALGHPMVFRAAKKEGAGYREFGLSPAFESGDGTFGFGLMTVVHLSGTLTDIRNENSGADGIRVASGKFAVYPNPFNSQTNIQITVPVQFPVRIAIISESGETVKVFDSVNQSTIIWNGTNDRDQTVTSGRYLVRLETGASIFYKKILLLK